LCCQASVIETIGNTPMIELRRLTEHLGLTGHIYAKLEMYNPGLSKKDRIALQMIEEAEQNGTLKPGQCVVELTSGNTGTGLAIVCAIKSYPFVAIMSKGNSRERARMMSILGAEVVLVDQHHNSKRGQVTGEDIMLLEKETDRIVKERNAFRADQFSLIGNFRAHYLHTGVEIITQMKNADLEFDAFVDFVGTAGTFSGIAARLKEDKKEVKCYVVEPEKAVVLGKTNYQGLPLHKIQGGGYSKTFADLKFLDPNYVDGCLAVTDEEAVEMARLIAKKEGILAGFSSGANVAAAVQLLKNRENDGDGTQKDRNNLASASSVVCLLCDSGMKYLSTDLYD